MERIDRRTYISVVVGGTLVIAGCAGDENDEPDEPDVEPPDPDEGDATASADEPEPTDEPDETDESDGSGDSEEPTTVEVGERLEVDDLHLVVSGFDRAEDVVVGQRGSTMGASGEMARGNGVGAGPNTEVRKADEGSAFAVVDLALQYAGDEPVATIDDSLAIELADEREEPIDSDEAQPENDDEATGVAEVRLAPGEVARGDLVYEIADDTEELVLLLEFDQTDEEYVVALESEAEPAETIEQDLSDDALEFSQGVETGGMEVTVTGLEHGNNLGGFMQSDEGYEIVAVGVRFENGSGREHTLSAGQAQLKDEFGRSYEEAAGAVRALEDFDGDVLEDGEEYDRKVAYQLEEGASELYWVFDFEDGGEDRRAFWKLR